MKKKRLFVFLTVLLLLLLPTVVFAQDGDDTVVETGETIRNEVVLFGEDLTVQEGAVVNGDVALFSGNATIAGNIEGDIVLFGGNMTLASTAAIDGDCVLFGGNLTDDTESGTGCSVVSFGSEFGATIAEFTTQFDPPVPPEVPEIEISRPSAGRQFFGGVAEAAGETLVMALLAFGVASLLPNHLLQTQEVVRRKPMTSGAVGVLTAVAVPVVLVLLTVTSAVLLFVCIGILGFPLVFLLAVGFVAAMFFGWITMGNLSGRWLAEKMNLQNRTLPVTAALGTAALTFGIGLLGALPFMIGEGLLSIIIGSVGLGAATLTRFGTRPYPLPAGYAPAAEKPITEDPEKISSILETLPVEEVEDLKDN